ncbi:MAG: hypothetical protein A4E61_01009 [Syntrophorhabdus sp. PtaB.Bin184]|nr:MAG: hypothetical protein A4E61_01009 [Syntrophorhabdus sp. PtaB.Bin184]
MAACPTDLSDRKNATATMTRPTVESFMMSERRAASMRPLAATHPARSTPLNFPAGTISSFTNHSHAGMVLSSRNSATFLKTPISS